MIKVVKVLFLDKEIKGSFVKEDEGSK